MTLTLFYYFYYYYVYYGFCGYFSSSTFAVNAAVIKPFGGGTGTNLLNGCLPWIGTFFILASED